MPTKKRSLGAIIAIVTLAITISITPIISQQPQLANAFVIREPDAHIAASGNNAYVTWSSNKSANWEILFRASNNNGATFGDKIHISSSTKANSFHSDVAAFGDNVYVSFHDNKTGNVETYLRTSADRGQTFGNIMKINGTGFEPQKSQIMTIYRADNLEDSEENTRSLEICNSNFSFFYNGTYLVTIRSNTNKIESACFNFVA